jgi:hypothetical protein
VATVFYRADGSTFWVSVSMRSVRDGDGNVLYLLPQTAVGSFQGLVIKD